ncbi:MAG: TIGR00269 family protein [Candidatus Woesearchaeota archaeon]
MDCFCGRKSIYENFCKEHFLEYVEKTFLDTINRFNLFSKKDRIVVAASGGKDSLCVLYLLKKFDYNIDALLIDEGIKDYREVTKQDLIDFCNEFGIDLKIVSFKEEFSYTLDEMVKKLKKKPCTVCGIFRRYLLNKYSKGYDVLVTGHNMDDEVQSILMNLLKNQIPILARIGPISGIKRQGFVKRVKPLYLLTEKEIRLYVFLNNIKVTYKECPYTIFSFRNRVIDFINAFENSREIKRNIIEFHLTRLESLRNLYKDMELKTCKICNEPSTQDICNSCKLVLEIKK